MADEVTNTELRERARTFLGTSLDEWARHVLRLLDENERCSTCEKCGWYTCEHDGSIGHADEIARLKAENAALVKERDELRREIEQLKRDEDFRMD